MGEGKDVGCSVQLLICVAATKDYRHVVTRQPDVLRSVACIMGSGHYALIPECYALP